MKQTAVEWLASEIQKDYFQQNRTITEWLQAFEQAKQMEKEQIIDAAKWGYLHCPPEQYYNETYKTNEQ